MPTPAVSRERPPGPLGRALLVGFLGALAALVVLPAPAAPAAVPPQAGGRYSDEAVRYFLAVALGSEYGRSTRVVRKWQDDLRITLQGQVTEEDRQAVQRVLAELEPLLGGLRLTVVPAGGNVEVHFLPRATFSVVDGSALAGDAAFFRATYEADVLRSARIFIDSGLPAERRAHFLAEEMAQSLGVMNASLAHPDSVFYDGRDDRSAGLSPLDRTVVEMLYRPEVRPGHSRAELDGLLRRLR
jgi:hypothetical protein